MQVDLFEFMISMYRHQGIQVLTFENVAEQISEIDYGFRGKMLIDFDYAPFARNIEQKLQTGICYLYEDGLKLYYSFYRFPEELAAELHCRILCLGPFQFRSFTHHEFMELMEEKKISPHCHTDFMEFFNRVPLASSADYWNHTLVFFLSKLCGFTPEYRQLHGDTLALFSAPYMDYAIPAVPDVALTTIEERYRVENEIMSAVAIGDIERALQAHHRFRQYKLQPRVADPVRNCKNLQFTFNTLLRKAAEAGHVHPLHVDNLSRQFAIQIENCLTIEQLNALSTRMLHKYCILVNNYSRRSYSSLVQTCMDYIDFHYNMELSLGSLAKLCSVSGGYLSALFKKEVGVTITNYINSTRIHQALILLNTTKLPISEIASRCGFSDANYFTRTFKKLQGQTPKQYCESI